MTRQKLFRNQILLVQKKFTCKKFTQYHRLLHFSFQLKISNFEWQFHFILQPISSKSITKVYYCGSQFNTHTMSLIGRRDHVKYQTPSCSQWSDSKSECKFDVQQESPKHGKESNRKQLQQRSRLCFDNYCFNLSKDLKKCFGDYYNANCDRFHFYSPGQLQDWLNRQIGNFTDVADVDDDDSDSSSDDNKKGKIGSENNCIGVTGMYEILKCYFKTKIKDNMNKITAVIKKYVAGAGHDYGALKNVFINLLQIICDDKEIIRCIGKINYNQVEFIDLCSLFLGETMSKAILNCNGKTSISNRITNKIAKFLLLLMDETDCESCFDSLISTSFAVFFMNKFVISLIKQDNMAIKIQCEKKKVLTAVFDFIIAQSILYQLSPKLEMCHNLTTFDEIVMYEPRDDTQYLQQIRYFRRLFRNLDKPNNCHKLLINDVHYKGKSLLHYTCQWNLLESTGYLIDFFNFDCDKQFNSKVCCAYEIADKSIQSMFDYRKIFGSFAPTLIDDINNAQENEINVQFMLLAMGVSLPQYNGDHNQDHDEKKNETELNLKLKPNFERKISTELVLDGIHQSLLNLIDKHLPFDDKWWTLVDKYLRSKNKLYDICVLQLKTLSMMMSLTISDLQSEQDLFHSRFEKSLSLLSSWDVDLAIYVENTLLKMDKKHYLSNDCDSRIENLFQTHLTTIMHDIIIGCKNIKLNCQYMGRYYSNGNILLKFASILKHSKQKQLYQEILTQTKIYKQDWNDIKNLKNINTNVKITQDSIGGILAARLNNNDDVSNNAVANKPDLDIESERVAKYHARNDSQNYIRAITGDKIDLISNQQEIELNMLYSLAAQINDEFHNEMKYFCDKIVNNSLIHYNQGPLKTKQRLREKIISKKGCNVNEICDINRGTINCFDLSYLNRVLKQLILYVKGGKSCFKKIVKIKNTFKNYFKNENFADIKVFLLFESKLNKMNKIIVEIQLNIQDMIQFQQKTHCLYEIERSEKLMNQTKTMMICYKKLDNDNDNNYNKYHEMILKGCNTRGITNSILFYPNKICNLMIHDQTFFSYLGYDDNVNQEKAEEVMRVCLDYLLYLKKHFVMSNAEYVSHFICQKSFNNEPFIASYAFGINCNGMKRDSKTYKVLKHIFENISIPNDIDIDISTMLKQRSDLSELYLFFCKYLSKNRAIRDAMVSCHFVKQILDKQCLYMPPNNVECLLDELKFSFNLD